MTDHAGLAAMGQERFVSLTTFRRTGEPVPTAVWVTPDGEGTLLVTTGATSGKVKRIRRNDDVELRPCTRSGKVADDAPVALARAEVLGDAAEVISAHRAIKGKYGLEYRIVMTMERLVRRCRTERVVLRLRPRD